MRNHLLRSRRRTALGIALALVTLAALATLAVAADFGAPAWLCFITLLWCGTLGLPTTVAALSVASFWGRFEPCFGFVPFLIVTAACGLMAQVATLRMLSRNSDTPAS